MVAHAALIIKGKQSSNFLPSNCLMFWDRSCADHCSADGHIGIGAACMLSGFEGGLSGQTFSKRACMAATSMHPGMCSSCACLLASGQVSECLPMQSIKEALNCWRLQVVDGNVHSKWLDFGGANGKETWLEYSLGRDALPVTVSSFELTSANDFPERDPRDFTLEGSTSVTGSLLAGVFTIQNTLRLWSTDDTELCADCLLSLAASFVSHAQLSRQC